MGVALTGSLALAAEPTFHNVFRLPVNKSVPKIRSHFINKQRHPFWSFSSLTWCCALLLHKYKFDLICQARLQEKTSEQKAIQDELQSLNSQVETLVPEKELAQTARDGKKKAVKVAQVRHRSRSLRSDTGKCRSGQTRIKVTRVKVAQVRHGSRLLRSDTGQCSSGQTRVNVAQVRHSQGRSGQGCSGQTHVKAAQVRHGSRLLRSDTGQG